MPLKKWLGLRMQIAATVLLAACGPTRQTYWTNPNLSPAVQQRQFTLDSTECTAIAYQQIPEPQTPPQPQPQSGTIYLETPEGPIHGTYNSRPATAFGAGSVCGSISACMQQGERQQARRNYAVACIESRGWQQRIVGQ